MTSPYSLTLGMISAGQFLEFEFMFLNMTKTKEIKHWFLKPCSSEFRQFPLVTENGDPVCFPATSPSPIVTLLSQLWIWYNGINQC